MWEVVKTVKGYDITRMIGSRGAYHVSVREGKGFREFHTFKNIKIFFKNCKNTVKWKI